MSQNIFFVFFRDTNPKFVEALTELESDSVCQSLSLHSFLMLPMQRVTRLPLLFDAILTRLRPNHSEYETCHTALATLNKVIETCHTAALALLKNNANRKLRKT